MEHSFFKLKLPNGEHIHLMAESVEEKQIWMKDIHDNLVDLAERGALVEEQAQRTSEQKAELVKQRIGIGYYHAQSDKK